MSSSTSMEVSKNRSQRIDFSADFFRYCKKYGISLPESVMETETAFPKPVPCFFDLPRVENGTLDQRNLDFIDAQPQAQIPSINDFVYWFSPLYFDEMEALLDRERPHLFYLFHDGHALLLAIVQFIPLTEEWHANFYTAGYHREHFDFRLVCKMLVD